MKKYFSIRQIFVGGGGYAKDTWQVACLATKMYVFLNVHMASSTAGTII